MWRCKKHTGHKQPRQKIQALSHNVKLRPKLSRLFLEVPTGHSNTAAGTRLGKRRGTSLAVSEPGPFPVHHDAAKARKWQAQYLCCRH